ncbi:V-set domain-containing T-cell activation inhibitor 1-like [Lycodopsis pacificus]
MNVLLLACLCLLTLSVTTTDGGPAVIKVEQDSDVILPCSLSNKQDITAAVFDWKKVAQRGQRQKEVFFYNAGVHYNNGKDGQSEQFRGRVSHFGDQLKHGNASIIITNTKMADSGHYTCAFPLLQTPQTFYMELVVGAAPKPSVTSLDFTKDWSLLQCEAHGNPQPAVEWQDSDGNTLPAEEPTFSERGGSFYVTLNITVTKTDRYRCVATQKTINHQIHAETSVYISGSRSEQDSGSFTGWIGIVVAVLVTLLVVGVILAVLVRKGCITSKSKFQSTSRVVFNRLLISSSCVRVL